MSTSVVQLHSSALKTQEIEIRVILMLCHTEYFPSLKVKHNLSMTLVLLNQQHAMETVNKPKIIIKKKTSIVEILVKSLNILK